MLTVVCGEDIHSAYNYLSQLQKEFKAKGFFIQDIKHTELESILKEKGTTSLFNEQKAYFTHKVDSLYLKLKNKAAVKLIDEIAADSSIQLIDWEEGKSGYEIKLKKVAQIKEFKPSKSIFQLLDACYPSNLKLFITSIHQVAESQEEGFIFAMLSKHVRTLILAKLNSLPSRTPPWQKAKLYNQSKLWPQNKLLGFYEGLARIDQSLKTSNNIYGIVHSLDVLACYYL